LLAMWLSLHIKQSTRSLYPMLEDETCWFFIPTNIKFVEKVLSKRKALYRSSDVDEEQEVYNHMKAIEFLEESERRYLPITEEWIKKLHAIIRISHGRRPRLSKYRTEQNKVGSQNQSGFYMPPEHTDVPVLMEDYVAWLNSPETHELSAPIRAGIAMWQFLTIHPYMDGNGRTARLITTYILKALQIGLAHNYYFGRHDADLTSWLEYFLNGLAEVYKQAAQIVQEKNVELLRVEPELIRKLDYSPATNVSAIGV
jgi:hypothetical protein